MNGLEDIWNKILENIESKISNASFGVWFSNSKLIELSQETAVIEAGSEFNRNWLEEHYVDLVSESIFKVVGEQPTIHFVVAGETPTEKPKEKETTIEDKDNQMFHINSENTFETFVIGNGNRFAHAASLAVAEAPAKAYNPLFIYGGVGLGKTHLMHAIGNYIRETRPESKVAYLSSERFTNDFINSIRDNKPEAFREKYRNIDVLLIDDIQFLAGKEQTQEEFFHTFNDLHQNKKQIVISSDRPPKEIPTLEDRLRTRFEWGLIVDITPPDFETRMAILQKKIEEENLDLPVEALTYIANSIQSNIRELEGALTRVLAYSKLRNKPINTDLVAEALKDIISTPRSTKITIQDIQQVVGKMYNVRIEDFSAKKRTKSIAYPRQIAMYLSRELTDFSLPKIGEEFGGRDHTTVIHAHEKIRNDIENNPELKTDLEQLEKQIRG